MIAKPETDTPETDAAILREINAKLSFGLTGYTAKASGQFVDAEFARKLERERDMSLYDATQETLKVSALKSQWIAVCQERDEAREAFAIATDKCVVAQSSARQWRECAENLAAALIADSTPSKEMDEAMQDFYRLKGESK